MKKLTIYTVFLLAVFSANAQSKYETILQQIEENNTTLAALRQQVEAQKLGNRTGLLPANPEVEFNYLWGNNAAVGNRTDFSVRQTFDFPTVYTHRNRIANLQNENVELLYKAERLNILLSAKQTCVELMYFNALMKEYAVRLQNAERIAEIYKTRLEKGDANILEHNRAQLNLATVQTEMARIEIERTALLAELKRLNGGKEINFNYELRITNYNGESDIRNSQFVIRNSLLPLDFGEWYARAESKNPVLQHVRRQVEIGQQQIKLNRAMSLPKFSTGYMSERMLGEHFQGITLGMSIPLWENRNRVREAKAQVQATEAVLNDSKMQFYNRLQTLYQRAVSLQQNAQNLRRSLNENSNEPLLKKALNAGEISLLNYFLEIEFYYNAVNRTLEAERDFELAAAELWIMEM